ILTICTFKGFSCTCNPDLTDKELIRKSEYAFIAEVISNVYKDDWTKQFIGEKGIRTDAKVRIVKLLKGNILTEEVIVISSESSSCEINLIPGKRYLITGTEKYNKLAPAISDTPPPIELNSTFDPDTSIFEQPKIKSKNEWIEELQQTNLVVFTSVCQTRYRE
ncbi:MAG: hypothetical protein O9262_08690, partial [Cyclobacteriaceae bacterium]|nr:hypothetical protein [Cyclobacteriaceae bacterium]